ncbi:MAG: aminoacetone oxidase family FAD-binding enzyme [Sphaerochaetaceae bacterium]
MHQERVTAIIGGGPGGLLAALLLAKNNRRVRLYERNSAVARKLLLSGGGQCNLTNLAPVDELITHYGANGEFLKAAFTLFPPTEVLKLCASLGLPTLVAEEGRVFPASKKASDVAKALYEGCLKAGVEFLLNTRVEKVRFDGQGFHLNESDKAELLLIATGGVSYPHTGSTGDGLIFSQTLGHTIVTTHPALSSVKLINSNLSECSGITIEKAALQFNGMQANGSLLITHQGLSGPLILNASRYFARRQPVKLSFLSPIEGVEERLKTLCRQKGASQIASVVHLLGLPTRLVDWIFKTGEINGRQKAAEVSKRTLKELVTLITGNELVLAVKEGMVSAGGVALDTVEPRTMESKLCRGLFFAGEVLDVDGDCGGYNLQAAFATAFCAAKGIVQLYP